MGAVFAGVAQYRLAISHNVYGDRCAEYEPAVFFGEYFDNAFGHYIFRLKRASSFHHASGLWSNI